MKIKLRYPALAVVIISTFAALYFYVSMNIEASLLEREIRLARYEKRDWERKNSAIRAEIARLEGEGYETIYWKLYGALPFYKDNTIIYVDLSKLHPGIPVPSMGSGEKDDSGIRMDREGTGQAAQEEEPAGGDTMAPTGEEGEEGHGRGNPSGRSWFQIGKEKWY